ncbi:hypothetical protein FA95DRAFT_1477804, partial [Auriscalpium vulgare]
YNGEPNYTKFMKWTLESKDFIKDGFISRKKQVSRLKKYLSDRAFSFYMRDVARNPEAWTFSRFCEALFDHCFPPDFRTVQREKYLAFAQRGHPVRDYKRNLEELADAVGKITDRDFAIRFWQGADSYLRVKWYENGYDPEVSSLLELFLSAERYERSEKLRRAEEKKRLD